MESKDAKKIILALADGVDPITGEVLPNNSPYQNAQVVRALHAAVAALERKKTSGAKKASRPAKAGEPWSKSEDSEVANAFKQGISAAEIAKTHQRTKGAIESRLVKLGLVQDIVTYSGPD